MRRLFASIMVISIALTVCPILAAYGSTVTAVGSLEAYIQYTPKELMESPFDTLSIMSIFLGKYFEREKGFIWDSKGECPAVFTYDSMSELQFFMLNKQSGLYRPGYLDFDDGTVWSFESKDEITEDMVVRMIEVFFPESYRIITDQNVKQANEELKLMIQQNR